MLLPGLSLPGLHETHVWQLCIPHALPYQAGWSAWLSPDECDRGQRFRRAEDRDRFILSRAGLRYLLARYLNCAPDTIAFTYSPYGKPSLAHPPSTLTFNLSHSGQWVIYGIGYANYLGVDVEQLNRRTALEGLIQRCLTPAEQASLPLGGPERLRGFCQYWTIKEAHLKAIGLGLSYPIDQVQVDWLPEPWLACPAKTADTAALEWTIKTWWPSEDAIAAVCVGQADSYLSMHPFPFG